MRISSPLLVLTLLLPGLAVAQETIEDPKPGQLNPAEIVQQLPDMPKRGSTKDTVRGRLGDPQRTVPPVGDPPISRWVYERFTVYFEHDRVLHSVKHGDRDRQ